MKIGVIGTRGFPDIQGGIETHCMELYTRIAVLDDCLVTVYRRKPYLNAGNINTTYKNIRFIDLSVPKSKYFETFLHSLFATIHALFQGYDVVHYHNTGPGFFIPLLKLTKAKIVFTYHNVSYTQKKWNNFAKRFLSLSERISMTNSDFVIFISEIIKSEMIISYKIKDCRVLFNGVKIPEISFRTDYLESLGLEKGKYIIGVGRFMEEKGFEYFIRAFKKTNLKDVRMVLVGDADYPTEYSTELKALARKNNVVLTGFIKGEKLNQIYSNARLFVMSSFTEGLPIALLEAMSYNLDVVVSDIPANLQIGLKPEHYFRVGDEEALSEKIIKKLSGSPEHDYSDILTANFSWERIAAETNNIYKYLLI